MNIIEHYLNFQASKLLSATHIDDTYVDICFDDKRGVYSYIIHVTEKFWNDQTEVEDIKGITIHNRNTKESLALVPYPEELEVDKQSFSKWIRDIECLSYFKKQIEDDESALLGTLSIKKMIARI